MSNQGSEPTLAACPAAARKCQIRLRLAHDAANRRLPLAKFTRPLKSRRCKLLHRPASRSGLLLFCFLFLSAPPVFAQVSVEVSTAYSAIQYVNSRKLMPGDKEVFDLEATPFDDAYKANLSIRSGPLRIVVVDSRDINTQNPKPTLLMDRVASGTSLIDFPRLPSKEGIAVILMNQGRLPVLFELTVFRLGSRPSNIAAGFKRYVELPVLALDHVYKLPKFRVQVKPCGSSNAYSNPDTVICTELLAELSEKGLTGALYPILLHELAHSLLFLWDLPGYDNEDVADEFAAIFLAHFRPDLVDDYIKWLDLNDSVTEAVVQLVQGDRHTLSVQRARNLKIALTKSDELTRRWSRLLSPFVRR